MFSRAISWKSFLNLPIATIKKPLRQKSGLWFPENALLERADLHPPMKKQNSLMWSSDKPSACHLQKELTLSKRSGTARSKVVRQFARFAMQSRMKERLTVLIFSEDYKFVKTALKWRQNRKMNSPRSLLPLSKCWRWSAKLSPFYRKKNSGLSDEAQSKFDNPYSLAQLYNLIETERNGFSKVSLAAHLENAWRMTMTDGSAQCCRLPADCVRPFDGFIRKAIDRNSWEVAKRIAEEVKKSVDFTNGTVKIPVAIEANSFNFHRLSHRLEVHST